ncbi:carboxylesterase/lipase family protein [Mucilaginibacter psychrotolerans]|uniref:Carboxylic ester hydrolase n=1 Tax=Mucilaginibacter psychrotolerans TaxID=1524096 RepID=A0A4Y8SD12_9SPHI|nr:carboxylesterase family protein [Mucilaginibacter psychrotolerans]TFF36838.1 carboxylesterase/lipase family protein [Mucilaginibacter psychrotolerans]
MSIKITLSALLCLCLLCTSTFAQTPDAVKAGADIAVTSTVYGKVKGYVHNSIFTFKGIPYAKADRFTLPQKPTPWTDVRSSMTYGPVCPTDPTTSVSDPFEFAFNHNLGYNNEHCQTLNVWTQKLNDGKKRPVMVWLHGGGFTAGSAIELPSYDGENLAKKGDVVLVSVNHRLNVLGFLDLSAYGDKYKNSGNAGLADLVAALQWVKENIAQFGGDPNNVTIFGQSGGGGKVTCMMNSPMAKGLFQKAIVESGSYITSFTDKAVSQRIAAALLTELHLQPSQVDSLQKIPYETLNLASKKAIGKVSAELRKEGHPANVGWNAVLDGEMFPYQPADAKAMELGRGIPLLVGTTKNEFTPFALTPKDLTMDKVKTTLQQKYGSNADAYMAAVKQAYPNTSKPSEYIDIEFGFRSLAIKQADQKSALPGAAPVYTYLFTWQSPVNDGMYKAMHCMDIAFQFDNIKRCEEMTGGGKDAYALASKISSAWINFAATGNPNTPGLPQWPAYTTANGAVMILDVKPVVRNHPDAELLKIAAAPKP